MARVRKNRIFNQKDRFVEGWYWALPAADLRRKQVKAVHLLGRDLVVYRGEDGVPVALDAYCPHMGAHLAEGRVEGNALRCFFHNWKFAANGACIDAPCSEKTPRAVVRTWPAAEHLGMIWVWTGDSPAQGLPYVPDLKDENCDVFVGNRFIKNCHPSVVLINAIDEHHFNSVHDLPVNLYMKTEAINENVQTFSNTTCIPDRNPLLKLYGKLYRGPLTYSMCYHFGSTGSVTVGPDMLHFHIVFSLRLIEDGKTEGQTILVTKRRPGAAGQLFNRAVLAATKVVGDYFAKGDTQVFQTMQFDFVTPTKADHAIIDFIQHVDAQRALSFGSWAPVTTEPTSTDTESRRSLEVLHA